MSTPRAIDAIPPRDASSKEMQVLCLGLSRTGTASTKVALDMLGYRAYHCGEQLQYDLPEVHYHCWREALRFKNFGAGESYGPEEFGKLLRNYSATTDMPCNCFPKELIEAFPNAKVIFSTRDPDSWLRSVERCLFEILESDRFKWFRVLAVLDTEVMLHVQEVWRESLRAWTGGDWNDRDKLKQVFIERRDYIRSLVPEEGKLLEWNVQDGWEPLCQFLDKPVPTEPFPSINKGDEAARWVWDVGVIRIRKIFADRSNWPMLVTALGGFLAAWVTVFIYPIGAIHAIDYNTISM